MNTSTAKRMTLVATAASLMACTPDSPLDPASRPRTPAMVGAVDAFPQSGIVGREVARVPGVFVGDQDGQPVEGILVSFTASEGGSSARDTARTNASGIASPGSWKLGTRPGAYTLTATVIRFAPVEFQAYALPGPIASVVQHGNAQAGRADERLPAPIIVGLFDEFGNPLSGIRLTATPTAGSGTIEPGVAETNADGFANLGSWRLGADRGSQRVRVDHSSGRRDWQPLYFTAVSCASLAGGTCLPFPPPDCEGPSGCGEIVFVSHRSGNAEIYSMNRDGTGMNRLTDHPAADVSPAWSPDGKRIAFISDRSGQPRLYIMEANGTNIVRHANDDGWLESPSWSPDGSEIAVSSWSPNGRRILVLKSDPLLASARLLTNEPFRDEQSQPSWSPDGKRLAFNFSPNDESIFIGTVNPDGTSFTVMTTANPPMLNPAWSPDGRQMAVNVYSDSRVQVGVLNESNSLTRLSETQLFGKLAWSPDGKLIAYSHGPGGARGLSLIAADGLSQPVAITSDGYDPDWRRK